jgi:hypothetical protein
MRSDDVVATGLRLLWQLDTFVAEVDAHRLDELSMADRETLCDALMIAAAVLTAVRRSTRPTNREPLKLTGNV